MGQRTVTVVDLVCDNCGEAYTRRKGRHRTGGLRTFCSRECFFELSRITRMCEECGVEFRRIKSYNSYNKPEPRFCSRSCSWAEKRRRNRASYVTRDCPQCGKSVTRPAYMDRKRKYCSRKCQGLARYGRVKKICRECHKPYEVSRAAAVESKYCSRRCVYEARRIYPQGMQEKLGSQKSRDSLDDRYMRHLLLQRGVGDIEVTEIPQELIELQRAQLLLKRELKAHHKGGLHA